MKKLSHYEELCRTSKRYVPIEFFEEMVTAYCKKIRQLEKANKWLKSPEGMTERILRLSKKNDQN